MADDAPIGKGNLFTISGLLRRFTAPGHPLQYLRQRRICSTIDGGSNFLLSDQEAVMWVRALLCCVLLSPLFFLAPTSAEPTKPNCVLKASARPTYKSPLGLVVDEKGERAHVALHTAGTVAVVDLKAGKVLTEIRVGNGPFDVAIQNDTLAVTCSRTTNWFWSISSSTGYQILFVSANHRHF